MKDGKKEYQGILLGWKEEILTIEIEAEEIEIERKNVAQLKTIYHW